VGAVALEDDGLDFLDRPTHAKRGVVPEETPLVVPRIGRIHLIQNLRVGLQRAETVCEAIRDKKLIALFGSSGLPPTLCP
jgi:hypothetical protein